METDAARIRVPWSRIERWCAHNAPRALETLRPGAGEAALRAAEATLGHALPADVRASYALHDGCAVRRADNGPGFLFGWDIFSLERMVARWTWLKGNFESFALPAGLDARAAYAAANSHPELLPLTSDWGGNYKSVDLTGAISGRAGQIVAQERHVAQPGVVAGSFGEYLARFADELEDGVFVWVETFGLTDAPDEFDDPLDVDEL